MADTEDTEDTEDIEWYTPSPEIIEHHFSAHLMPAEVAKDEVLRAAYVIHWCMSGFRLAFGVHYDDRGRGVDVRVTGFEAEDIAASVDHVLSFDYEARACSGSYSGCEDPFILEAVSWVVERTRRIHAIDGEIALLTEERRRLRWDIGERS
jgi:hypothetical protein